MVDVSDPGRPNARRQCSFFFVFSRSGAGGQGLRIKDIVPTYAQQCKTSQGKMSNVIKGGQRFRQRFIHFEMMSH